MPPKSFLRTSKYIHSNHDPDLQPLSTSLNRKQPIPKPPTLPPTSSTCLWDSTAAGDAQTLDSIDIGRSRCIQITKQSLSALKQHITDSQKHSKFVNGTHVGFFLSKPKSRKPYTEYICFDIGLINTMGMRCPTYPQHDQAVPVYWTDISALVVLQIIQPKVNDPLFIYNAAISKLVYCNLHPHCRLCLTPIRPLHLIQNSIASSVALHTNQHSTGYITITRTQSAYLLDNQKHQLPLAGVWVSGARNKDSNRWIYESCQSFYQSEDYPKSSTTSHLLISFFLNPGTSAPSEPQFYSWRIQSLGIQCLTAEFLPSRGLWIVSPLEILEVPGMTQIVTPENKSPGSEQETYQPINQFSIDLTKDLDPQPTVLNATHSGPNLVSPESGFERGRIKLDSNLSDDIQHTPPAPFLVGDQVLSNSDSMHDLVNILLKQISILNAQLAAQPSIISNMSKIDSFTLNRNTVSVATMTDPECNPKPTVNTIGVNTSFSQNSPSCPQRTHDEMLHDKTTALTSPSLHLLDDPDLPESSVSIASRPPLDTGANYVPVFDPHSIHDNSLLDQHVQVMDNTACHETMARIASLPQAVDDAFVLSELSTLDICPFHLDHDNHQVDGGMDRLVATNHTPEHLSPTPVPFSSEPLLDPTTIQHDSEPELPGNTDISPRKSQFDVLKKSGHLNDSTLGHLGNLTLDELDVKYLRLHFSQTNSDSPGSLPSSSSTPSTPPLAKKMIKRHLNKEGGLQDEETTVDCSMETLEYLRRYNLL